MKLQESNKIVDIFMANQEKYELDKLDALEHIERGNIIDYSDSWDRLMPVVEKIEDIRIHDPNLDEIVSYHRFRVDMNGSQCEIYDTLLDKSVGIGDEASKLASTYKAVVEFINWYNKHIT